MAKIEDAKINKRWIGEGGWREDFSLALLIAAPLSIISQCPQAQLAVGFIQSNHLQEISQAWNNGMSANVNFDVHKFLLSDIFVTHIFTKERVFRRLSLRSMPKRCKCRSFHDPDCYMGVTPVTGGQK